MSTQSETQLLEQKRRRLRRRVAYAGVAFAGVLTVSSLGFVLAADLNMCQVVKLAGIGPGLYAQAMQLPHS